jgi:hypothetical protein
MKRNMTLLVAGILATGLIAAGCGGDDDDGDGGGDALTKEEFLAQGNAICEEGNAEIETAFESAIGNQQPTQEQLIAVVEDSLIPSVQGQIDDIRELAPPEEDEDRITEFLDKAELALQDIKEDPSLATQEGGEDPFAEVNQEATEIGLTACAS